MPLENRLKQVGNDRPADLTPNSIPEKTHNPLEDAATAMLLLGIKTLSQRALVALSNIFTLLTCVSAFVLWQDVLPNPNSYQLTGLGLYGVFILLLHIVRQKHGNRN
jgi:hypothetical protein